LEAMAIDIKARRLYVSDKAKNRIDIIDLHCRVLVGLLLWDRSIHQLHLTQPIIVYS
jgi:hypothetical protein